MKSNKSIVKNRHIDRWKQKHPKKHPINNEKKSNHEKRSRDKGECRNIRKGGNNKNEYYEKAVKGKKKNYRQDKKDGYRVNKNFDDIKGVSYQREEKQYDIYIRNIPHDCTKDELKDVLSHYGPVSDIDIRIRKVGDHRYGLASFKDSSVGGKIIQEAHENLVLLKEMPLHVEEHMKSCQIQRSAHRSNRGGRVHGCQKNNKKRYETRRNFLNGRYERSLNDQKRLNDRHIQRREERKKQINIHNRQHETRKGKNKKI